MQQNQIHQALFSVDKAGVFVRKQHAMSINVFQLFCCSVLIPGGILTIKAFGEGYLQALGCSI